MKISTAESQIMDALWRLGPLTPEDLAAEVGPANGWARNTVRVMVTKLLHKGAISSAKEDGRFQYRPILTRKDYVDAESRGLLDRLFDGRLAPLVSHFAEHKNLTPEALARLNALIAEIDNDGE
jgi:BlaI family penicillinase repressor